MKINWLLVFMPVLLLACENDPEGSPSGPDIPSGEVNDTLFWDMPHTRFMGLNGAVASCIQIGLDEEGVEAVRATLEFDTCGHLVGYDPLGLSATQGITTYEIGWIDPTTYRYEYNEKGQLIRAISEVMGEEPVTYQLTYGDHGHYVPLPFALGAVPFFLVRDLVRVEGGGVVYTCDGKQAVYSTESWTGTTSVVFGFDGDYPVKCTETMYRNTDTSRIRITNYVFGEKGELRSSSERTTYPGEEQYDGVELTYLPGFWLLPSVEVLYLDGEEDTRYKYEYDAAGNLLSKSYVRGEGTENPVAGKEETNVYAGEDQYGNWTIRTCTIPGLGLMDYRRELIYW